MSKELVMKTWWRQRRGVKEVELGPVVGLFSEDDGPGSRGPNRRGR